MKGRHSIEPEHIDSQYFNLPTLVGKVTPITLHGRTEILNKFNTPGPTYIPPGLGSDARKVGMSPPVVASTKARGEGGASSEIGRRKDPSETIGPGPAQLLLREHSFDASGKVGVTIKGSHDFQYKNNEVPGPGAYKPKFFAVMPKAPVWGFHDRPKDKGPDQTPGYRDLGSTLGNSPKWTMKQRASDEIAVI
jgi:hypothetical protein